jgi:hypothetical protein
MIHIDGIYNKRPGRGCDNAVREEGAPYTVNSYVWKVPFTLKIFRCFVSFKDVKSIALNPFLLVLLEVARTVAAQQVPALSDWGRLIGFSPEVDSFKRPGRGCNDAVLAGPEAEPVSADQRAGAAMGGGHLTKSNRMAGK